MSILDREADTARYVGDHVDGATWWVRERHDGWYVTVTVDSESVDFADDIYTDYGPFPTEEEADQFGHGAAEDWCIGNNIVLGDEVSEPRLTLELTVER